MDKKTPNFYINQGQLDQLIGQGGWRVNDLPTEKASGIKAHFANFDAFAFFSSGIQLPPIGSPSNAWRAGIDWIRMETRPKPGESALNVYHYVVGDLQPSGYPVYKLDEGGLAPHWAALQDLEPYFATKRENEK